MNIEYKKIKDYLKYIPDFYVLILLINNPEKDPKVSISLNAK
jgi:hypothetical protein